MTTFKLFISSSAALLMATSAYCSNNKLPGDDDSIKKVEKAPEPRAAEIIDTAQDKELQRLDQRREESSAKLQAARVIQEKTATVNDLKARAASLLWKNLDNIIVRNRVVKYVSEGKQILPKDMALIMGSSKTAALVENEIYVVIREELNQNSSEGMDSRLLAKTNKMFDALAEMPSFNGILTEYSRHGILPKHFRNVIRETKGEAKEKLTKYLKFLMDQRLQDLRKNEKKPTLSREQHAQMIKNKIIETRIERIRKQFSDLSVIKPEKLSSNIQEIEDADARNTLEDMLREINEGIRQMRRADEAFQVTFAREDLDTKYRSTEAHETQLQDQLDLVTKRYQDLLLGIAKSTPKPVVEFDSSIHEMKSSKRIRAPKGKLKRTNSMESIPAAVNATSVSSDEEEGDIKPITFKAGNEAEIIFTEAQEGNKTYELLKILQESRGNLFMLIKRLSTYPGSDLHELNFDRKGQYSIKISRGDRICFSKGDGVFVNVEIVNYH